MTFEAYDSVGRMVPTMSERRRELERTPLPVNTFARSAGAAALDTIMAPVTTAGRAARALGYPNKAADLSGAEAIADVESLARDETTTESRERHELGRKAHPYAAAYGDIAGEALAGAATAGAMRGAPAARGEAARAFGGSRASQRGVANLGSAKDRAQKKAVEARRASDRKRDGRTFWRVQDADTDMASGHRSLIGAGPAREEGTSALPSFRESAEWANTTGRKPGAGGFHGPLARGDVDFVKVRGDKVGPGESGSYGADGEPLIDPAKELRRLRVPKGTDLSGVTGELELLDRGGRYVAPKDVRGGGYYNADGKWVQERAPLERVRPLLENQQVDRGAALAQPVTLRPPAVPEEPALLRRGRETLGKRYMADEKLEPAERFWRENPDYVSSAEGAGQFLRRHPGLRELKLATDANSGMNRELREAPANAKRMLAAGPEPLRKSPTGKLRGGTRPAISPVTQERGRAITRVLEDAARAGHTYKGTAVRGVDLPEETVEQWLKSGYVDQRSMWSATADTSRGPHYTSRGPGAVELRLRGKSGVPIEAISKHPQEHEIAFPPGRKWKITGQSTEDGRRILDLEEVDAIPEGVDAPHSALGRRSDRRAV